MPAATTARLAELQARIRPHFLFNTLNTAMALVREEPAQAEEVLADLADCSGTRWPTSTAPPAWRRRSSWRAATWPSSRCALASACAWNGRWTRAWARRSCRR
jgi:hypothetical protein